MKKLVVTLAYEYSQEEKLELESKLFKAFGECQIEYHVDEEILGGVIVFDGAKLYDGSIKNRLKKISNVLKQD